jgi:ABC-type uncharacterized transport system substrate-binding protein
MDRRAFIEALAGALLAAPLAAEAQRAAKMPHVGFLDPMSPSVAAPYHDAFRQALRQLGYAEGQNIAIEYRFAVGRAERLPNLAAELVRSNVDVIVAGAAPAVDAAHGATRTDPHRHGRVRSRSCESRARRQLRAARREHHRVDPPVPGSECETIAIVSRDFA